MKKVLFLLFFTITYSVFSTNLHKTIFTKNNTIFLKHNFNNSLNSFAYNIKKADIYHKKSTFINKVKNNRKIFFSTNEIKETTTNSLQALTIKLDSIKQLHQKGLLKKDILTNTNYYNNFLLDLKKSSIVNNEYIFLENELLKISVINTTEKYKYTYNISLLLGTTLIGLLFFIFLSNKKKTIIVDLTKQEILIKKLITDGKTNKEIASELHISLNTVKTHISNIYQKLNISNRKDLIAGS